VKGGNMEESKSINKRLIEIAPKASRVALSFYINWTEEKLNKNIAAGIKAAMKILPASGSIRKKNDKAIVKAITWLLDDIPRSDKRRAEIEEWIVDALKRMR
jgi:hypothetical protein